MSRSGGTGRRARLKIVFLQRSEGSIPSFGTIREKDNVLVHAAQRLKGASTTKKRRGVAQLASAYGWGP
jgi:hypothetical protein